MMEAKITITSKDVDMNEPEIRALWFSLVDEVRELCREGRFQDVISGVDHDTFQSDRPRRYNYPSPMRYSPPRIPRPAFTTSDASHIFVFSTEDEARTVRDAMMEIYKQYSLVTVGDLHELVGLPITYVDRKKGWGILALPTIRRIANGGFLLDLPEPGDISMRT